MLIMIKVDNDKCHSANCLLNLSSLKITDLIGNVPAIII